MKNPFQKRIKITDKMVTRASIRLQWILYCEGTESVEWGKLTEEKKNDKKETMKHVLEAALWKK